jgi:sterol desaturase/sphingolipid hydroxylase (fatty acid hydroxylase superfamily)
MNSEEFSDSTFTSNEQILADAANAGGAAGLEHYLTIAMGVLFVLLLAMELIRPYRRFGKAVSESSITTNTAAFLFNNIILTLLSATSLFVIAQHYSHFGLLGGMDNGAVKFILSFLLYDFAVYTWHVASHHNEFLWRFHKIHHSDKSFNVTTGFRFHVFDTFIELIYKSVVIIVLGLNAYTVLVCELIKTLFVMFHHCNISFEGEKALGKVIIVPYLHRLHHSALRSEHDSNYGIILSIWDRIFGTRKELVPKKIGLELIEADNFVQLFTLAFITEKKILKILQMLPKGKRG